MKDHFCPSCEQAYGCPRGEGDCGSPHVYDCLCCYQRRHSRELTVLARTAAVRFGHNPGTAGDLCYGT